MNNFGISYRIKICKNDTKICTCPKIVVILLSNSASELNKTIIDLTY